MRSLCSVFFVAVLVSLSPTIAKARPPFVAGFERFARHEELDKLQAGRLLLSELSCTACHAGKENHVEPKGGPRLAGIGDRLEQDWIKKFLAAPATIKPDTTMPEMFTGWPEEEKNRAIDSLIAFLGSQQEAYPEIKGSGLIPVPFEFWSKGDPDSGKKLYHQVGCVACHQPDTGYETAEIKPSPVDQLLEQLGSEELEELGLSAQARRVESVPWPDLAAKYTRKSLTHFLLDPESIRPAGRMPSLKLQVMEAADIAAYLLRDQNPNAAIKPAPASAAKIQAGRELFVELRCSNCHEAAETKPAPLARPLEELLSDPKARTCFNATSRGGPAYSIDTLQVNALLSVLHGTKAATAFADEDRLQLHLLQLNCYACHERDNQGGVGRFRRPYFETVGNVDIGDEGRLPPALSAVGRKLPTAWMSNVLKGTGDVRPHLRIRMPKFPAKPVNPLPGLFGKVDQTAGKPASESEVFGKLAGLAEAGRVLLDNGCVECHSFRGEALPGVVGVDLEGITNRVHPDWFHDFLLEPGRLKPRTRMPTFFPGGKSQNAKLLQGEPGRQIAAIWAYLKELDKQPLPEKIERIRSQDFELRPQDRPMVLRTFMKEAGTHAIAVGFPQGMHFAFDAENSRIAAFWRGRFLDAQGTWFSRFTPPAEPLGEDLILLPDSLPLALLREEDHTWPNCDPLNPAYRFMGYRLDDKGVPTFLYRYDQYDIEDRMEPDGDKGFKRRLTIKSRKPNQQPPRLWFRPLAGKKVKQVGDLTYTNDDGLTVVVSKSVGSLGELLEMGTSMEWRIPLTIQNEQTIEVQYRW